MHLHRRPRESIFDTTAAVLSRRAFLARAAAGATWFACAPGILRAAQTAAPGSERELVQAAIPARAFAIPRKPRKLLIFDLNVNYGGHASIPTAELAFELMGRKTGAFDTVVSRGPEVFRPESLRQFDGVFFNNCVGNLFTEPALRQSLVDFVYGGGGMMGVHGTTVAFTQWPGAVEDWPEFGLMIGARGANHRANTEQVFIKLDEPAHPVNQVFGGQGFDYRDEFFRVHDPFSRRRVRVLLSIDNAKTDFRQDPRFTKPERADNDFALAWVRHYGRGRTFYCTIAHNPYVFRDARMLSFYLAAAQFILGDLAAPTVPSALASPAVRAQEKLGWRLGLEAGSVPELSLFQLVERAAALGLPFVGSSGLQQVSESIPKSFDAGLSEDELRQVRFKLDAAGVRLLTHEVQELPGEEAGCRSVFEFARKIGVETLVASPKPEALKTVGSLCDAYNLDVALQDAAGQASGVYGNPARLLRACAGGSHHLGACADLGRWLRSGQDPVRAVQQLQDRLLVMRMHDPSRRGARGHDVAWGTGVGKTEAVLKEVQRLGIRPSLFGLPYSTRTPESVVDQAQCVGFFNGVSLKLAEAAMQH
jgi:type 1 glutamine amidotransferase/sugar phosphate isomerase/epimerase